MDYNMYGILNSRLRLTGLSSGLDVDSIVQQLMRVEQIKVDRVKQSRTLLEWKRDDYRSIINNIRAFKDEYFDILKPATNMRSAASLSAYKTTYNGLDTSSYFTATAGTGAVQGTFSVSGIQLAQSAKAVSSTSVTGAMQGIAIDMDISNISAANDNNKITVKFNGTSREITIDDGLVGIDAVIDNLNAKLESAFGEGKIKADKGLGEDSIVFTADSTNILSIDYAYNAGYNTILASTISSPITLDNQNNKFNLTLDDTTHTIVLDTGTYQDADAIMSAVQEKVNLIPELDGKIRILNQNNRIVLKAVESAGSAAGILADTDISDGVLVDSGNNTIDVTIDGVTKSITLEEKNYTKNQLLSAIQTKLNGAFGANKAMVSMDEATKKMRFEGISQTSAVTAGRKENGGLDSLGFTDANKSNKVDMNAKLSDIEAFFKNSIVPADGDGDGYDIEFTINGKEFSFNSSQRLNEVISVINGNSEAGVRISYDQLNDKFTVQSKAMGVSSAVQIEDTPGNGNLMEALGLAGANKKGTDASMTYDDGSGPQTLKRASNEFSINGIEFSLKSNMTDPIEVNISGDPGKTLELVKDFVNKYNDLIEKINSKLSEKRYSDYSPLTDEQKKDMTEKEIDMWEEKAKSGMLRSDSILSGFLSKMREVLYKEVEGVSKGLYSIGISTGTWDQKGKLVINEAKLKEAIINSPDEVINLFTKESTIAYSANMSAEDRYVRDSENGIANKLYDVMQDYIRTARNNNGQKGILLEKAGITGDLTENTSDISKQIQAKDLIISNLLDKLINKENQYYKKFTAMETALNQMNNQILWLGQQMDWNA